jgi:hypothetical protein
MVDRVAKKIDSCVNKFANGPYTNMPDGFVKIFKDNGFLWGGDGWGRPWRIDSMHFEYPGQCGRK